jgi:hypothetical protein
MPALPIPPTPPTPAYRIGFFGPAQPPNAALEAQIAALLRRIARRLIRACPNQTPLLRLVLPAGIAGAETLLRLARQELANLQIKLRVDAILPHAGATPPPGTPAANEQLMQTLVLDGDPASPATRTPRALGRMVMRNCDLMLMLWDGDTGQESELLRFTARQGPSLLWLRAGAPPVLIRDSAEYYHRDTPLPERDPGPKPLERVAGAPHGAQALQLMGVEILRALIPPHPHTPHPHGLLERLVFRFCPGRAALDPYKEFLGERDHRGGGLWAAYVLARNLAGRRAGDWKPWILPAPLLAWVLAVILARALGVEWLDTGMLALHLGGVVVMIAAFFLHLRLNPPWEPELPAEDEYWLRAYHAPDRLSIAYANRHRSSYVLVILLIALALGFAVLGIALTHEPGWKLVVVLLEAAVLVGIVLFVAANIRGRWQQKWIAYRLLAELCRKQDALARLGWSLPVFEFQRATGREMPDGDWVAWHFNALLRAAPLPRLDLSTAGKAAIREAIIGQPGSYKDGKYEEATGLLESQLEYHGGRRSKSSRAAGSWALCGEVAFFVTALVVALKLFLKALHVGKAGDTPLAVLAAVLPAVSAAFFALRQYSEEKLMAEQSVQMHEAMLEARHTLRAVSVDLPLSSQDLAAETYEIAMRMLADVTGWAQLVRVKVVEAG